MVRIEGFDRVSTRVPVNILNVNSPSCMVVHAVLSIEGMVTSARVVLHCRKAATREPTSDVKF